MTKPRLLSLVVGLSLIVFQVSVNAASRGITVGIRASERSDAPIAENVELYSESYALVIGIDEYTNGWPKLSNAIKDAEVIAKTLENKGFEVELHKNLDSDELLTVFKKFFILKGDSPSARLFIWFAGHGMTLDGEGYLVPANAPVPKGGGAEFKFTALPLRDFGTYMRQAVSKHVYAVFDSCFAGTVFSSQRALPPAAITRATTMPVRQFLTSGDADQTVSDDGTFRELFVRAINGEERADANGDGFVTGSELGMFLGDRVTNLTQSLQTPRYGKLRDKDYDRGDFVFALPEGAVATTLQNAPASGSGGGGGNSAEISFWNSIQGSENVGEFEAYLAQYPDGAFAQLAMVKKTELERKLQQARDRARAREVFKVTFIDQDMEATRTANVRETPFPTATRVGQLEAGSFVWAVGETTTQGGTWYKVARDGVELGFVYGPLLASVGSNDTVINVEPLPTMDAEVLAANQETEPEAEEERGEPQSVHEELSFLVEDLLQEVAPVDAATAEPATEPAQSQPQPQARQTVQQPVQQPIQQPAQQPVRQQAQQQAQEQQLVQPEPQAQIQFPQQSAPEPQPSTSRQQTSRQQMVPTATISESLPDEPAAADETLSPAETYAMGSALSEALTTGSDQQVAEILKESGAPQEVIDEFVSAVGSAPPEAREMMAEVVQQAAVQQAQMLVEEAEPVVSEPADAPDPSQQIAMVTRQPSALVTEPEPQPEPEMSRYVRRYVTAAETGNSQAMLALGYMYETGDQVPANAQEAIKWYTMAGNAGEVDAMISLALMYESGAGVRKNMTEAAIWYRKAATAGHADAQQTLGYMYENGSGVVKDVMEAARWYERAALQGRVAAQNNLGRLYQLGIGVPQDLDQAVYWYEKAAAQGSEAAQGNLDKLIVAPTP